MRRLFWCAPPRPVYRAGALAVSCFDARFETATRKFLRRLAGEWIDHVRLAGGAKALASGDPAVREFLLDQVRASIRLHDPERILLVAHADCGAYGGLEAFDGNEQRELAHHREQLARASAVLREAFPSMPVGCYFVNFEGAWEFDIIWSAVQKGSLGHGIA